MFDRQLSGVHSIRDVVAGDYMTITKTYDSAGEYIGRHGDHSFRAPQLATSIEYTRDVMSGTLCGQMSWGPVHVVCETD